MSDETSKFGAKYEVYLASDENKDNYLMGLLEISDKSARITLHTFKEILHDFDLTCLDYERKGKSSRCHLSHLGRHTRYYVREGLKLRCLIISSWRNIGLQYFPK